MVELFQKLAVSKGGALVAARRRRNSLSFESARKGEFPRRGKRGNHKWGFPFLTPNIPIGVFANKFYCLRTIFKAPRGAHRVILSGVRPRSHLALLGAASQFDFATAPRFCFVQDDTFGLCPNAGGRSRTRRAMRSIRIYEGKRRTHQMVTEVSYPRDTIMWMVGDGYQEAPSGRELAPQATEGERVTI